MGQFKPMVKMETTEPSVELKLKKGGRVKMQMGGVAAAPLRNVPRAMPNTQRPVLLSRKKGGIMETAAHERNERDEIKRVEKELKGHERKAASLAHKGLKKGGMACAATGGVVNGQTGYKKGGSIPKNGIIKSEKGRSTMSDGANPKQLKGPTGVVKKGAPAGFKTGGKAVKGCKY
jgi:hypothetical protein